MGTEETVFGSHYPTDAKMNAAIAARTPAPDETAEHFFWRVSTPEESHWLPAAAMELADVENPSGWPTIVDRVRAAHASEQPAVAKTPEPVAEPKGVPSDEAAEPDTLKPGKAARPPKRW